ncbi:MAG TPA: lytic transglycosylase domain-containing protein [Bryobacteraceae bacterium]|nr:lytic transglycosylase domain-containing protein [Bryobacteraceae bacterium]
MRFVLLLCLAGLPALCGEYAVLSNGFRIHTESHERDGDLVRLHTGEGDVELPASSVSRFEQDDYFPPPPPVVAETPAPAAPPADPHILVNRAADAAGLPRALVHSVVRAESAYRMDAVSPKGAVGLMQLMPGTAAALKADPNDPAQNVVAGAMYLRQLLIKYEGSDHQVSKALAAYNAGAGAVDKYKGVPPYSETRNYVQRVISTYNRETAKDASADSGDDHSAADSSIRTSESR